TFEVPFNEPFQVFGKGPDYHFVTASGKYYFCTKQDGKRVLKAAWKDAYSPIRAVVVEASGGRAYAFTEPVRPDEKKGQRMYFEMGGEFVEGQVYERKPIDQPKLDPTFKHVYECAQVLLADKQLKDK